MGKREAIPEERCQRCVMWRPLVDAERALLGKCADTALPLRKARYAGAVFVGHVSRDRAINTDRNDSCAHFTPPPPHRPHPGGSVTLGELIKRLEAADPDRLVPFGFHNPQSYRGYYNDLAFEPTKNTTVREMLAAAKSALDETFEGYKGGEYRMGEHTDVWLAYYGECGEGIGPMLLSYMLGEVLRP